MDGSIPLVLPLSMHYAKDEVRLSGQVRKEVFKALLPVVGPSQDVFILRLRHQLVEHGHLGVGDHGNVTVVVVDAIGGAHGVVEKKVCAGSVHVEL